MLFCTALIVTAQSATVLPQAGAFAAGTGTIGTANQGSLSITQNSSRGIIDWSSFSIGAGGRVFINNGMGATLNRVLGGDLSKIDGLLESTGSVYLINPNGIVIGPKGTVLTNGSFVASTRDVSDTAFLTVGNTTFRGTSTGNVTNLGSVLSREGNVLMIGSSVENSGSVTANHGMAALTSGNQVLLTTVNGPAGLYVAPDTSASGNVTQTGRMTAAAAALKAAGGNIYTLAGNRSGLISATGTKTINGQVWLTAPEGTVETSGVIKASNANGSGGEILANGRNVHVAHGAVLSAQGTSGGKILVGTSAAGGSDLAQNTAIANGATILAGGAQGGGHIETSGRHFSLGRAAISAGKGGSWLVDPTDLTIDAAAASTIGSTLDAGTDVTEVTTANSASGTGTQTAGNGDITVAAPITWTGSGGLTLSAYNDVNINAAISGGGTVTATAGGAINANASVGAANVMMSATGNLTLALGATVAGTTGVTLKTTGHFINNAGASALSGGSGGWLVYSTDPSQDTTGGLTPDFYQYAANGGATPAASGNGLLYSIAPSLAVSLGGTVTKTYDGTTTAPLTGSNATVSGLINSDTATVSGTYATKNAGSGIAVTASGVDVMHAGSPVYGYAGTSPSVSANIGEIDKATLTATVIGNPTKTYNGTTTAELTSANYQIAGFATGEGASVNQPSSVAYDSADAGNRTVSATFGATNFVAHNGTSFSNYTLPTSASGAGTINPAPLLITGVVATNKTYDGTATDPLNASSAGLYGVIGSDAVSLVTSGAAGTFASANAGSNQAVTASGFYVTGAKAPDYQLMQPQGLTATINQAPLTISGITAISKTYDGTNVASLNTSGATLSGVVAGDTITLTTVGATGTFSSADAGSSIPVTTSSFNISGNDTSNYRLAQPTGLSADINQKVLSLSLVGTPTKIYNGSATATVTSSDFDLSGFISGQSGTVAQTALVNYASPNAGTQAVTATLAPSDYAPGSGTKLSNYALPTTATGTGVINQAPVTISVVGNPTKTYDGTAAATLSSSNFLLNGFLPGQSATVTQTAGTYDSANAGQRGVSATIPNGDLTPAFGTLLSNYSFPATATGYGTINPAAIQGGIYAAITGNPTKTYDGTTVATLTSSDFSLTGFMNGDGATVTQTVGQYATKNVGTQPVTASLTSSDFTPNAGTNLTNYTLPSVAYGTGTINPGLLGISIATNPTKVYNGTTTASLLGTDFTVTGLATGEGITIANGVPANYDSTQAGPRTVTAALPSTDITPNAGTLLSNYTLPTSALGTGTITQAPINILNLFGQNKTYETTRAATLGGTPQLFGVVGSDQVTLDTSGATAQFSSPNVGTAIPISASGFAITGTDAANYQLSQPTGLSANINRAGLTITGVTANNKNYDATNAATLNTASGALSGIFAADNGLVGFDSTNASATFASVNVGNHLNVSASGFTLTGSQSGNYSLSAPSGLSANILPAPLTAVIIGNPTKVYDGSASTTLFASNYQLLGFAGGQGATVPQSASAAYVSANAGSEAITSTLVSSDFVANSGTNLANYTLPTTGSGTGTITQAPLTIRITGNPTKTYDATTAATLSASNYVLSGFVSGQSATVTQTSGAYGAANAGSQSVSASLAGSDYSAGGGTLLGNYQLPTSASGTGTITKAPLQVVSVNATNRPYNGTYADALDVSSATVSGLFASDTVNLNTTGATGLFAQKDAGTGISVTASGFTMSGGASSNYTLAQPTGLSADITQASLSLTNVTRVYDSTTGLPAANSAYTLSGIYGSDAVTVDTANLSGNYNDKNVGTGKGVSLSSLALSGAQANDYSIASSLTNAPIGTITPAALTVGGAVANNKAYDGTTAATVNNNTAALAGLFGGDQVSLDASGATVTFANKNVGTAKPVTAGGYTVSGTDASNYTFTQPTGLSANITPYTGLSLTSITKIYDGTGTLPSSSGAYALSGLLGSDSATVNTAGISGSYATTDVGSGLSVSLSGLALQGTDAANYSIASSLSNQAIGIITPKSLSATIIGTPTKTYDATTAATLTAGNYSLSGFVSGQGATVGQTSGTYSSANAGSRTVTASLGSGDFTATGGTLLSNYTLPTTASGSGLINKAPLAITGVSANDKVYTGTTAATLNISNEALSGVVAADLGQVTLSGSGSTGTFASALVGTGISVTASGFTMGGAKSTNYTLSQPTGLTADITQALLSLSSVTKVYDATTAATGAGVTYTLSGIQGADAVSLSTSGLSGTYAAKNVGTGLSVSLSGLSLTGAKAANYSIGSSITNALIGTITKAPLTISGALAVGKTYDGTTTAAINNGSASLNGVLASDVVTFNSPSAGTFSSANAGTWTVTAGSNYSISGMDASNYNLTQPTGFSATISKAPLTATIIGTPTKTYDAVTTATLASGNYSIAGFIGAQSATVSQTAGTYSSANAGANTVTATLSAGNFTAGGGTTLSNYTLPTSASGAGLINQKSLSATIINNPTKTYDATTAATLGSSNYQLTGFIGAQGATVGQTSGTYSSANAGSSTVTASLSSGDFTAGGGTTLSNYVLPTSAAGSGTISPQALTATIINTPTKTYDATTAATLGSSNYQLTGFIGAQGATVGQTSGTYSSASAGARTVTATLSVGNFTAGGGTTLSNYTLPTSASGAGLINQKSLTATIINNPTKTYDATTAATLGSSNYQLTGFIGAQSATVGQTSGTYSSAEAGSNTVTASLSTGDFTAGGGTTLSNYVLPTSAAGTGTINQKSLSATIVNNPTKTYDGTTAATLGLSNYQLTGFIGAQSATVGQTSGTYSSASAGAATVTTSLSTGDFTAGGGTTLSNYVLPTSASGAGTINQKSLGATIINNPTKTYDATTAATLGSSNYQLTGFVGSQSATVGQTSGTYSSANAGSGTVTASLSAGDFTGGGGTTLSNYILPTSASGAGTISQKILAATIINNPIKTYDATTAAALVSSNYQLTGFIGAQSATVGQISGTYSSANAGSNTVTASLSMGDFTAGGGTTLSNYVLPTSASGAGTINQKSLGATIINNPTKTYDATTAATLVSGNYQLTGFVGSQGASVGQTSGTYSSPNAGSTTVTTSLTSGDFTADNGTTLSNYSLPTSASGAGTINQKSLGATIVNNPTKTYDATTAATLASSNYQLTGFVNGQGASVGQTSGTYSSADAGSTTVTASLGSGNFTADNGTILGNYILPASASGAGTISQKSLDATIINNPTKTYDATTAATLVSGNYQLTGFVGSQGANVGQASGTYSSSDAGSSTVTASLGSGDFTADNGTSLSNYALPTSASGAGTIQQKSLGATIINNPTKTYDGTMAATLGSGNYQLTGFVSGQGANVGQTSGTYSSADAGSSTVTASLASGDFTGNSGTNLNNYALPTSAAGSGTINQKNLGAAIINNPTKTYDATTAATLDSGNYQLTGFVNGQGASVGQSSGTYSSANAGSSTVTASLRSNDFTADTGTTLSNYVLPTSASGTGSISQKNLSATIVNNPAKTYDATTAATLTPGNYTLTGFVGGQGATVNQNAGTYSAPDAGSRMVTTSLSTGSFTADSGTNLANYVLPTTATGSGTIDQRTLSVAIGTPQQKTYDGTTAATLNASDYALTGFVGGQSASITQTNAAYDSANAGSRTLSASLAAGDYVPDSGTDLANYALPTVAAGTGTIHQKTLSVAITGNPAKTYDATTAASLSANDYTLTGFVGAQSANIHQTTGIYNAADAGTRTVSTSLNAADYTAGNGTLLSNYALPTTASGAGQINPAQLSATLVNVGKTYDGTNAATVAADNYSLSGFIAGQAATVTQSAGSYASADAGRQTVTANLSAADLVANAGTNFSNYLLPTMATGTGSIAPKTLAVSITGSPGKVYDGSTLAQLGAGDYTLTGFVKDQSASINQTAGVYDSGNAGVRSITSVLASSNFDAATGTILANYVLPTTATGAGTITGRALTIQLVGTPTKMNDGTLTAWVTPDNFSLTGFVAGQGAAVTQNAALYDAAAAGTRTVTAMLTPQQFLASRGTLLSNYILPTVAIGPGLITPAVNTSAPTLAEAVTSNMMVRNLAPVQTILQTAIQTLFAAAVPRTYIPYPAPGALSTWQSNGFGLLPAIVDSSRTAAGPTGSGAPVINTTEQILLQGGKNKTWNVEFPRLSDSEYMRKP